MEILLSRKWGPLCLRKGSREKSMQNHWHVNQIQPALPAEERWSPKNRLGRLSSIRAPPGAFRHRKGAWPIFWNAKFSTEHQARSTGSSKQTSLPKTKTKVFSGQHILSQSTCVLILISSQTAYTVVGLWVVDLWTLQKCLQSISESRKANLGLGIICMDPELSQSRTTKCFCAQLWMWRRTEMSSWTHKMATG